MKKTKAMSIVVVLAMCVFTACGNNKDVLNGQTEELQTENINNCNENKQMSHIEVITDGPEEYFHTVPMYYQQDYGNVCYGENTIAESGNLITCLSMLDSLYKSEYITPDVFVEDYSQYICPEGVISPESLINAVAQGNGRKLYKTPLKAKNLPYYVIENRLAVLVHIPHSSIYGQNSSYIIITDIDEEGNIVVRDPNKYNIEQYGEVKDSGETTYSPFEFMFEAGENAILYILGGGVYEIEEDEYLDIEELPTYFE